MTTQTLETRSVRLEVKATTDGVIEGYASRFGEVDQGGDIVARGAYTASLAEMAGSGQKVKMLWQHDPSIPVGVWDEVREDDVGLYVKGRVLDQVEKGREAIALIVAGAMDGLSIGYRTLEATRNASGQRVLQKLALWEVSLVTFPMQATARIDATKAADLTRPELERLLTQNAGLSRSVARALMGGGIDAIKAMHDAGDGIAELAELLKARCTFGHATQE